MVNKKGFSMVDAVWGFAILSIIVVSATTIMLNQMAQLKKSGNLTKTIYTASKYLQEETISVQKKIKANDQASITHPTDQIILFNGNDRTVADIYKIELENTIKDTDIGSDKITTDINGNSVSENVPIKFNREYVVYVSSKIPTEPELAVAQKVDMTANFPPIPGVVSDQYNKLVNYNFSGLKLDGTWEAVDLNKVYANRERKTWQLSTKNFIAPMFVRPGGVGYDENDPDVGKLYPKFKDDYIEVRGTENITISNPKYLNRNILYAVKPVSKEGKIGEIKQSDYAAFPLEYPLRGSINPSLHLNANYITPDNYQVVNVAGTDKKVLTKLNKPITNDDNGITIGGQIILETNQTGRIFEDFSSSEIDENLARDVYTRGFSFNGSSNFATASGFVGYTNMTVFVVARVNENPLNQIPIISFDDGGNKYRFRLYSTGLSVKSNPNAATQSDFLSIASPPEKDYYALYTIRLNQNGTTNLIVNDRAVINNNVPIGPLSPFNGSVMLSKFGSGESGDVDIAEIMVYDTAIAGTNAAGQQDVDLKLIKDYFISKYGISDTP